MTSYLCTLSQKIWYQKSLWRFFLSPFSIIFALIVMIRTNLYRFGLKKSHKVNCPVIIVGNITVGGTGKTPLVIALAHFFRTKGYQPGIIMRGYKSKAKLPQLVTEHSEPQNVGDEAVLLAKRTQCNVVVCPNRSAGAAFLLEKTACNLILSDDGLQHFALARTIEIAVIDSHLLFGNGLLLPAGPLREPISRLKHVDFCVINGKQQNARKVLKSNFRNEPYINQYTMQLAATEFINLKTGDAIPISSSRIYKKLHAVAGIGYPERFFQMLKQFNLTFTPHPFPDHYPFSKKAFNFLSEDEWIVMTEKDAVKCQSFADERYWYVPVSAGLPENFFTTLLTKVTHYDNKSQ